MADFRRCILAFAVVALLLGLLPTASAQVVTGVQCIANSAVPPTLRSEGLTELVGDIVLNCSGGTSTPAGQTIPQANITIFLNTQVTSRLYGSNLSEAILTVDEPKNTETSSATTCVSITGCVATGAGPGVGANATEFKNGINPNVFQGRVSGNSVTFVGIPIDPPGTQGQRIYRITNLRGNANVVGQGGLGTPGQIIALISATPATSPGGLTSTFAINNPTQIVGFVQSSLSVNVTAGTGTSVITSSGITLQQCTGSGVSGGRNALFGQLNFTELFPTAFKTRTVLGSGTATQDTLGIVYNSESGYVNPLLTSPLGTGGGTVANAEAGLADFGTRLKATFNNIPNGVSVFVSVNNVNPVATTSPVAGTFAVLTSSEIGAFSPVSSTTTAVGGSVTTVAPSGGAFQVPITNGSGTAIWEVTAANPLASQTYSFQYFIVASPSPSTNSPAVGTGTVNLDYAPSPTSFTATAGAVASSSLPIPRFVVTSTTANVVAVTLCRTNLLFPYVVNTAGFDTGLAISNTSTDTFGTAAQQGTCTLNFFGSNAPAAVTSPSVASGTTYSTLASSVSPNFLGYVIAVCNFQYGHGFAFISDVGARNLAMGYLALIIPDPAQGNRQAQPFVCGQGAGVACTGSGEQLAQ